MREGRSLIGSRVTAGVAIVSGLVVMAVVLAAHTFARADAGEQATDLVRAEMSTEGLRQHRADLEVVEEAFEELFGAAFPAFAAELRLSPGEFEGQVEADYPRSRRCSIPRRARRPSPSPTGS